MQLIQASDRDGFWITNIVVYVIAHIADYVRLHIRKHLTGFFDGHRHRKTHSKLLGSSSFCDEVLLSPGLFYSFWFFLDFWIAGQRVLPSNPHLQTNDEGCLSRSVCLPWARRKIMQKKKRRGIAEGDERPSGVGAYVLIGVYNKTREGAVLVVVAPVGFYPRLVWCRLSSPGSRWRTALLLA